MTAEQIYKTLKQIADTDGLDACGIRRLHDDDFCNVGDTLPRSWVWDDGDITDEQLDGTCAADIAKVTIPAIQSALDWIAEYQFCGGNRFALIVGDGESDHHTLEDGATIIHNAKVIAIWV